MDDKSEKFKGTFDLNANETITALDRKDKTLLNSKVLLVEDNRINQKITKILLEDIGCLVDVVDTGYKAVDQAVQNYYDIIILDIGLPDIDGFEVAKRIRAQKGKEDCVAMVALTAHILDRDKSKCCEVGIQEVMIKPVLRDTLRTVLKRVYESNFNARVTTVSQRPLKTPECVNGN